MVTRVTVVTGPGGPGKGPTGPMGPKKGQRKKVAQERAVKANKVAVCVLESGRKKRSK
jgi:hypothetical protein